MCKKKETTSTLNSLVFMNTPITSADEDVIGFSTYGYPRACFAGEAGGLEEVQVSIW